MRRVQARAVKSINIFSLVELLLTRNILFRKSHNYSGSGDEMVGRGSGRSDSKEEEEEDEDDRLDVVGLDRSPGKKGRRSRVRSDLANYYRRERWTDG